MIEGDWSEWRIHVLKELERQNNNLEVLEERFAEYEKTCLQKEGDQKAVNAEIRMKIYFVDVLLGAAGAIGVYLIQWIATQV
jgi:hypothetical protein